MTEKNSALDDIPGTTIFTMQRSRKGYHLNKFCMSLMDAKNRAQFLADEEAYLSEWPLTDEQKAAVQARDFQRMLDLGGNVYFLSKIFASDGLSYVEAVSTMTDQTVEEYQAMMLAGGRSPDGWRSKSERSS